MYTRAHFYLLYLIGLIAFMLQHMLRLGRLKGKSANRISLADFCARWGFVFLSARLRSRFEAKLQQLLQALPATPVVRPLHPSSLYAVRRSDDHEEYVFHQNYAHGSGGRVKHIFGFYCNCPLPGYPEMLLVPRRSGQAPKRQSIKGWRAAGASRSFRLYLRGGPEPDRSYTELLRRIEEVCPPRYIILAGKGLLVVNQQVKDTPDSFFAYEELLETAQNIARQF